MNDLLTPGAIFATALLSAVAALGGVIFGVFIRDRRIGNRDRFRIGDFLWMLILIAGPMWVIYRHEPRLVPMIPFISIAVMAAALITAFWDLVNKAGSNPTRLQLFEQSPGRLVFRERAGGKLWSGAMVSLAVLFGIAGPLLFVTAADAKFPADNVVSGVVSSLLAIAMALVFRRSVRVTRILTIDGNEGAIRRWTPDHGEKRDPLANTDHIEVKRQSKKRKGKRHKMIEVRMRYTQGHGFLLFEGTNTPQVMEIARTIGQFLDLPVKEAD